MDAARIAAEIADALVVRARARRRAPRREARQRARSRPQGQVKVTDFGIARAETSEPLTKTGAVLGTATYFSPEQAQGFALDGRSDVYALGVVLYEMLTGVAPFTASSPVSVAYKHVREAPAPPSSLVARARRARWTASCSPRWRRTSTSATSRRRTSAPTCCASNAAARSSAARRGGRPRLRRRCAWPRPRRRRAAVGPRTAPAARRKRGRWGPIVVIGIALALLLGLIVFLLANSDFGDGGTSDPEARRPRGGRCPVRPGRGRPQGPGIHGRPQRRRPTRPSARPRPRAGPRERPQDPQGRARHADGEQPHHRHAQRGRPGAGPGDPDHRWPARTSPPTSSRRTATNLPAPCCAPIPRPAARWPSCPRAGRPTVTVVVAREPLVPVPDVTTLDPPAALALLGQAGFQATQADTPSDTVPAGKVIGTDPAVGTPLPKGTAVEAAGVERPQPGDRCPSLVGQTRATAEAVLHDQPRVRTADEPRERGPDQEGPRRGADARRRASGEGLRDRSRSWGFDPRLLVRRARPSRSAVAPDARPVGDPRVGGDAPPDAGAAGGRGLRRVPGSLPHPGRRWPTPDRRR